MGEREGWYACDEHGRDDCLLCAWRGAQERTTEVDVRVPMAARAPDGYDHDPLPHRAFVMSHAMIREACREAMMHGVRITGAGFHGESKSLNAAAGQRMLQVEFDRWWSSWPRK